MGRAFAVVAHTRVETDQEKLWLLEEQVEALRRLGGFQALIENLSWAFEFIHPVLERRNEALAPSEYRPIEKLPDGMRGDVVFYNSCNGPDLDRLCLEGDAQRHRDDGCWTHFILLPESPK